jgi:hypothetical protein
MAFPVYIPFFGLKLHPHAHAFELDKLGPDDPSVTRQDKLPG